MFLPKKSKEGVLKPGESTRITPGSVILRNEAERALSWSVKMKMAKGFELTISDAEQR